MNPDMDVPPPPPVFLRHALLFVLGLLIGSPLVIESWKTARRLDPVRKIVADQRALTERIIQKVIRN